MNECMSLLKAFKQTEYRLGGHGPRDLQMLKRALMDLDDQLESDMYGKGQVMEDFETKMAHYLGKEAAVFFPSGTMAQQIALRIWCDQKGIKKVAYHPLCHLEIHEEDGLKELHHIHPILLAEEDRVIQLEDVMGLKEEIACLLLELPQREIGGQLQEYQTLKAISAYCREKGIKLHLDGARLFEILPYYQKSAKEIAELFDSVYVSVYKGLGGIAGAILAEDKEFTKKSKVWKRRHGGDLISLYPYILSADYYFEKRVGKMQQYFGEAKELAGFFNQCHSVYTTPLEPVSNMFHVHLDLSKEELEPILVELIQETGIGFSSYLKELNSRACYFELGIGDMFAKIPKDKLKNAFALLDKKLKEFNTKNSVE
ncbi:threonine aldolase family protein [Neobacillus cucumis]|uniref:Low specificity L-threonine aldolase n=1 Tax=Neobacillus cucumis TaxID=1740721 RepID=A0A2N5H660_9BACI|nr:beta-eliminating lyase-related protein [Neobacillus cucumis]PLS00996.1 low specificity L-threonine aldolase [Neobacillus cucumis]